ncbi:MAG: hypothetical protein SNI57_01800 [Rikenellaceae bacterium]
MKKVLLLLLCVATFTTQAQTKSDYEKLLERVASLELEVEKTKSAETKEEETKKKSRLTFGGYGEVTMSRHFYSDSFKRYSAPTLYADDDSYGRFDIPHAVFFVGFDFGRGWTFGAEIEFEHGGLEVAIEIEEEETGEYETEVENGGEVALEQFWINKEWSKSANLKMGHIILPVGQTNKYHMPNEYFGVFRPEGESTILPCAWHETGVSFWGSAGDWDYEVLFTAGLDSERFNSQNWIGGSSGTPYEFKIANSYAGAFRVDNHSIKNLTIGVSGYYGNSAANSLKAMYSDDVKGTVMIISADADYRTDNFIARANFLYGTLGDSYEITTGNNQSSIYSISARQPVASSAIVYGGEVGYNLFGFSNKLTQKSQKLFAFGRYEYYDSMHTTEAGVNHAGYCASTCISGGVNYSPMKEIIIKAEYQSRRFSAPYNNENTLSLGVTYVGLFKR